MSDGLGMRYAFIGPFETTHLNAAGYSDYCDRYQNSIYNVNKNDCFLNFIFFFLIKWMISVYSYR